MHLLSTRAAGGRKRRCAVPCLSVTGITALAFSVIIAKANRSFGTTRRVLFGASPVETTADWFILRILPRRHARSGFLYSQCCVQPSNVGFALFALRCSRRGRTKHRADDSDNDRASSKGHHAPRIIACWDFVTDLSRSRPGSPCAKSDIGLRTRGGRHRSRASDCSAAPACIPIRNRRRS